MKTGKNPIYGLFVLVLATIVYETAWFENKPGLGLDALAIALGDMQGFMGACSNIDERTLDLILHSPGGNARFMMSSTQQEGV